MKRLIFGMAALFAVAAPNFAAAQTGYAGLSYSSNDDADVDTWSLNGAAALGEHFQVDGLYANLEDDGDDADAFNVGGHGFVRNSNMLYGGYLGYNSVDVDGSDADEFVVAAEGQYYFNNATASGSIGYADGDVENADYDMWMIDAEYRYFITPNLSVQGNLGYADGEVDNGFDFDGTSYGVGAEYQLASVPVSIYGGWQQTELDVLGADDDSSSFGIGVRWNFGGTLKDRSQSGAGLSRPQGLIERTLAGYTPR